MQPGTWVKGSPKSPLLGRPRRSRLRGRRSLFEPQGETWCRTDADTAGFNVLQHACAWKTTPTQPRDSNVCFPWPRQRSRHQQWACVPPQRLARCELGARAPWGLCAEQSGVSLQAAVTARPAALLLVGAQGMTTPGREAHSSQRGEGRKSSLTPGHGMPLSPGKY